MCGAARVLLIAPAHTYGGLGCVGFSNFSPICLFPGGAAASSAAAVVAGSKASPRGGGERRDRGESSSESDETFYKSFVAPLLPKEIKKLHKTFSPKTAADFLYAWIHHTLFDLRSEKLKIQTNIDSKIENAQFALATSKTNYIDPRIIVSFCKRSGLELSKVLNATQIKKFPWALGADEGYKFLER